MYLSHTIVAATLVAQSAAFVPSGHHQHPHQHLAASLPLPLAMSPRFTHENEMEALSKKAMTLLTASVFAVGVATTVLPPSPAFAALPTKVETTTLSKEALAKMAQPERDEITAKQSYQSSLKTIDDDQKALATAKNAKARADATVKAAEREVGPAKKAVIAASDKLDKAKKNSMPLSAVKELTAAVGT